MRVAVVSDPISYYGGAERVLEQILALYPGADLFVLVDALPDGQRGFLEGRAVRTSFLQKLPMVRRTFRKFLSLWPTAIESLDVSGYDLVISSHHAVAHGVITGPGQRHVVYSHSPMRYVWDLCHQYLGDGGLDRGLSGVVAHHLLHRLRSWDVVAAMRPNLFVANSAFVAARIAKYYRRRAEVVYPPVYVDQFRVETNKEEFYFVASRLVPYKRVDLLVQAFTEMPERQLVIAGSGAELARLRAMAPPNVYLLGYVEAGLLRRLMGSARAFLFAGVEDFGIAPVEAQAAGTPVIGLGRGGLLETVRPPDTGEPTGVFFQEQTVPAVVAAIEEFERLRADITPAACRRNAIMFSAEAFRERFQRAVSGAPQAEPKLAAAE